MLGSRCGATAPRSFWGLNIPLGTCTLSACAYNTSTKRLQQATQDQARGAALQQGPDDPGNRRISVPSGLEETNLAPGQHQQRARSCHLPALFPAWLQAVPKQLAVLTFATVPSQEHNVKSCWGVAGLRRLMEHANLDGPDSISWLETGREWMCCDSGWISRGRGINEPASG